MDDLLTEVVGAFLSGLVGVGIALFTISRQNASSRAERSKLVRTSLSAEIGNLLTQITSILGSAAPARSIIAALGAVKVRVYPGLIPELGLLGPDLAAKVIAFHGHLEQVIETGQEVASSPIIVPGPETEAQAWLDQLRGMLPAFEQMLVDLHPEAGR